MIISCITKFDFGNEVCYLSEKYRPGIWVFGTVVAVRVFKSSNFRSEAFMVYYMVEPLASKGRSHNDHEWILEESLTLAPTTTTCV